MNKLILLAGVLSTCLFLLCACAQVNLYAPMSIENFNLAAIVPLGIKADKVLNNWQSNTLYAMNDKNQEIYIFREGERKNVLGGLGSSNVNFQYLADIATGSDNCLYVLDSSAKSVKKFSSDGIPYGSIELKGSVQPKCLCVYQDQGLFIFDAASGEIINYSGIDGTELHRFGRFQLQQVNSLFCNHDYLIAYDKANNISHIFSVLGQFVKTEQGQVVYDLYNNAICYNAGFLKSLTSSAMLPVKGDNVFLHLDYNLIALGTGMEVLIYKINYSQVD
ncbi:MAG TPA: hypothetical protein PLL35_02700 [Candidatus Cloacimonas sp.]|nr:hypothetical protein [Candidatus Cloacimonas sp.]HQO18208.1 hypothetical protein [Candidatus Cloacimonas sp.]